MLLWQLLISCYSNLAIKKLACLQYFVSGLTFSHEMLLAVPYERAGLPSLLAHLLDEHHYKYFKEIFQASRYNEDRIDLLLPKFKLGAGTKSLDLTKPIAQMGLEPMFDPHKADFERISMTAKLYVTAMVHKAMIEVCNLKTLILQSLLSKFKILVI